MTQQVETADKSSIDLRLELRGVKRKDLTAQEEHFCLLIASGMTRAAAQRAAGYGSRAAVAKLMGREDITNYIDALREMAVEDVKFGITEAHNMYMQAWVASQNATEQVKVVDSLVKLHGIAKEKDAPLVNVNINADNYAKQLANMSDEELLREVGEDTDALTPK